MNLSNFKWWRRFCGGTWHLICPYKELRKIDSSKYWTQKVHSLSDIQLKTEQYRESHVLVQRIRRFGMNMEEHKKPPIPGG